MTTAWVVQMVVVLLSTFSSRAKRDELLYCSACKAIVDELSYSVSKVDPKKTLEVGGFRLNPDGTMNHKKVPLARSSLYLSEQLESVCSSMSDYALHVDPQTLQQQYRRFAPRHGDSGDSGGAFPDLKNFQFGSPEASNSLQFACETLVEELEDDIVSAFSRSVDDLYWELCSKASGACSDARHANEEL